MAPGKKKGKNVVMDASSSSADPPAAILEELPKPITSFDMTHEKQILGNYKRCIEKIVETMRKGSDKEFTFFRNDKEVCSATVTPGLDQSPDGTYVIELKHYEKRLLLVGEKYQTWFRGIVTTSGERYEITKRNPKIMSKSSSLNTDSRYFDMLKKTVAECSVGYFPLLNAFHSLAGHDIRQDPDYMVALAVIVVMFFEAPRFPEIFDLCMGQLEKKTDCLVGEEKGKLIGNWFDDCSAFFEAHGEPQRVTLTDQTCNAVKRVATSIRLLCRSAWDKWVARQKDEEEMKKRRRR